MTLLRDIIDADPCRYEEVAKKKGKENSSSRRMMSRMQYQDLKGSSWFHHAVDGNIVGYKEIFVARGIDYEETFAATRNTHDRKNHVCE